MLRALAFAVLLLPAVAHADALPETLGTTGMTGTTGTTGTTGMTDSSTGTTGATSGGTDTGVPPPEYTPCGCGSERGGGPWALALTLIAAGWCRRRRPTS